MSRKYYSLLEKIDGKWIIQFGDYDKKCVQEEMRDMRYNRGRGFKANFYVVETLETQKAIQDKVDQLNLSL